MREEREVQHHKAEVDGVLNLNRSGVYTYTRDFMGTRANHALPTWTSLIVVDVISTNEKLIGTCPGCSFEIVKHVYCAPEPQPLPFHVPGRGPSCMARYQLRARCFPCGSPGSRGRGGSCCTAPGDIYWLAVICGNQHHLDHGQSASS